MNQEFLMAVKSSIDNLGYQIAQPLGVTYIDLDDVSTSDDELINGPAAVVWQLMTVEEYPRDPLYVVRFVIGAKTSKDPNSYSLIEFMAKMNQTVYKGADIGVYDYSGAVVGAKEGNITITSIDLVPQQFEETSGMRLYSIVGKAMRL